MMHIGLKSWLNRTLKSLRNGKTPSRKQRTFRPVRLGVETLECRIVPDSTSTLIQVLPGAVNFGQTVTLTATVSDTTAPTSTPTAGTVTFTDGAATLSGTVNYGTSGDNLTATLTTNALALGTHNQLNATYSGNGAFLGSSSATPATEVVNYTPGDLIVDQVGWSSNIASVNVNGSTVAVTTTNPLPYALSATGIYLAITGNSGTNINGSYPITITGQTSFTYTSASAIAGTGGTVSPASSVAVTSAAVSGSTVTITSAANTFVAGQSVTIAGDTGTNINGTFTILSVTSSTVFKYVSTGATAGTGGTATGPTQLTSSATAAYLDDFTGTTQNTSNTVNLPTAGITTAAGTTSATITGAVWNSGVATITTAAAHGLQAGQLVTIASVNPAAYDGTFTILSVPTTTTFTYGLFNTPGAYASGGTALVAQGALTEGGSATTQGYLTDSLDGHSISIAGYNQIVGSSTSTTADVGVVGPSGSVNDSTILPSAVGSVTAAISADGSGMWVSGSTGGIRYVSFGGTTPSAITGVSWSAGTATITAANSYVAGQSVVVAGVTAATGYNGTFAVLSASPSQFTYILATQPSGTPGLTSATSQLMPTALTNQYPSTQEPATVAIGTNPGGSPDNIIGPAGAQFQTNGTPSIDGPAFIGSGLVETGGNSVSVLGTGTGQNFPNATDIYGNFPTTAQIAVSPDGQTIFVADSRTDSLGGILEYYQPVTNDWILLARLQLDTFKVTGASEVGTTVSVTTSAPTDFFIGESVSVFGLSIPAYDGVVTVSGVSSGGFTYTGSFTGLNATTPNVTGASATSADGGFRGLVADFTDGGLNDGGVILYATTSGANANRLVKITGGNTEGNSQPLSYTVLATAAPGTAFRGVAFAPTAPGSTATTTNLAVTGSPSDFASGVTLTATVTSGATGWVSFVNQATGLEIGSAPLVGNTATLVTSGEIAPGSYSNIIAEYTGDGTYAPSTSSPPQSLTITKTSTSTSLTFSPANVGTATSETITAFIVAPAGTAPTGTVTFTNTSGPTTIPTTTAPVSQVILNVGGVPTVAFEATLTVPANTFVQGTYGFSAVYSGDGYFSTSNTTGSLNVVNSTTTTVTSSSANPSPSNVPITLTATVTSTGIGTPSGSIAFYDNTLLLGTATLNGSGAANLAVNTALVQSVTVLSASAATNAGTTTVTITTDANNPFVAGGKVVIEGIGTSVYNGTFTVASVSGTTFTYIDNAASGATTDGKGGLAIGMGLLLPGLNSISAIYTPTGTTFAGSTGVHEQAVQSLPFGVNDLYQERNGDGITPLNTRSPNPFNGSVGTSVFVDEFTTSGTLVQSLILPTADSQSFVITGATAIGTTVTITTSSPTDYAVGQKVTIAGITTSGYNGDVFVTAVNNPTGGPYTFTYTAATSPTSPATLGSSPTATGVVHAVVGDGQQSTTGQMTLSGDGQYLFVSGYDNNPLPFGTALLVPTGTGSTSVPRSIAQISYNGTVQTEGFANQSSSTGLNGGIFDGVYSPDGNQFYLSGFNGVYYFPSVVTSANLQGSVATQIVNSAFTITGLESYAGNLYGIGGGSSSATSTRIEQIGTGMPVSDIANITAASSTSVSPFTVTITANNNFVTGQSVLINGITGSLVAAGYGTQVTITSATSTQFTYTVTANPGTAMFNNAIAPTASLLQSVTQLPGIPVSTAAQAVPVFFPVDAYFTHTNGSSDTGLDTIYLADDGKSFGAGGITKWSYNTININSISEPSGTTATVTLSSPGLGLVTGEVVNILISGSSTPGYNAIYSATVTSPTTFTITTATSLGSPTTAGTASGFVENGVVLYSVATQQLGFYYLAGTTNPTSGAVTLYSNYGNGGNADFGPGIDYSVTDSNGFNNAPGTPITGAAWSSASGGTVTINAVNNYLPNQDVSISGITPAGYDGLFVILTANSSSFTYALATNPGPATSTTGAYAVSLNTISTVAFEGLGGGYAGNETYRGQALAPQAQTSVLVNDGPNPANGIQSFTLTITVASPGSTNGPTGAITLEDASNNDAIVPATGGTLSNGTATLTVLSSAISPGTHNLIAVYGGDTYHQTQTSNSVSETINLPISVNSVVVDAGTAPIQSLSTNGNVVTVTTDGFTTFTAGEQILITGSSNSADNGAYTVQTASSNSITFTYVDNNAGIGSATGGLVTAVGGTGSLGTGAVGSSQRSMVDSIVYTFNQAVTLGAGAFTIGLQPNVTVNGNPGQTAGTLPTLIWASPDGGTTWVVTFSGAGVQGNSIANGVYDITLNNAAVTANGGSGTLTPQSALTFYRLFGDISGTGSVTGRPDFSDAQAALGSSTGQLNYIAAIDLLASGNITGRPDFSAMQAALGSSYSGFTQSI